MTNPERAMRDSAKPGIEESIRGEIYIQCGKDKEKTGQNIHIRVAIVINQGM